MKILMALTYYRPHTSGLTIFAERLAKELANIDVQTTILTAQFERDLPKQEWLDNIQVIRVPYLFRVNKGMVMPCIITTGWQLIKGHDLLHLHLPQFDSAILAIMAWLQRKPVLITYHCDLQLQKGIFQRVVNWVVDRMNAVAGTIAAKLVTYTNDFAYNSKYLRKYQQKVSAVLPPVQLPSINETEREDFCRKYIPENAQPIIGMATRLATEKGVEILLDAMPTILQSYPTMMVLFAGQHENVLSEEGYYKQVMPRIKKYIDSNNWVFTGVLNPEEMAAFYPALDVLIVPSLNATEAFGLVQIEAMMNGVPVIASNLPGVRQPITMTGMGKVIPIGDAEALSNALIEVFTKRDLFVADSDKIREQFKPEHCAKAYMKLYNELISSK